MIITCISCNIKTNDLLVIYFFIIKRLTHKCDIKRNKNKIINVNKLRKIINDLNNHVKNIISRKTNNFRNTKFY